MRDFITNVHTVFNNDHDNSSGLGLGEYKEYWENYEGKLFAAQGVTGRYVRLYSDGSTDDVDLVCLLDEDMPVVRYPVPYGSHCRVVRSLGVSGSPQNPEPSRSPREV